MPDLKLDENLQPNFLSIGDYEKVEDEETSQQIIRLAAQDRLFNISERYENKHVKNKIRSEISRIASNQDFIESVEDISVTLVTDERVDGSGYKVDIIYNKSESYSEIISNL